MSTWNIISMERASTQGDNSDVVITLSWECTHIIEGEDVNYRGKSFGVATLDSPSSNFVSFSDITEETALSWCKNKLGTDEVSRIEAEVLAFAIKCSGSEKTTVTGVPW